MPRARTSTNAESPFGPGDFVKEYGRLMGWGELSLCNVMLEGTTDVKFFEVASDLYQKETGSPLIDDDFRVFAVGERNEGGTNGIRERLRQLSGNLQIDPVDSNGRKIRVVCLMDDDAAGRGTFNLLKSSFTPWQDIFKIQRFFPSGSRDPATIGRMWERGNANWENLDCEIEDLISRELLDNFVLENPEAVNSPVVEVEGAFHFDFDGLYKPRLVQFITKYACLKDLSRLANLLNELRWLMGLNKC